MTFRSEILRADGKPAPVADIPRDDTRGLTMRRVARAAALAASASLLPAEGIAERAQPSRDASAAQTAGDRMAHPYFGMWVTGDGRIRHELLPNGRYDEARGTRQSAYRGRYELRGVRIEYWDDTGFTADGIFVSENELHHGGMIFYRQR
jgi:hypothetical protein